MDKKTFLNEKYLKLCSQLGDAQIKLDQLTDHISDLKAQIKLLNQAFPLMAEYEVLSKKSTEASND